MSRSMEDPGRLTVHWPNLSALDAGTMPPVPFSFIALRFSSEDSEYSARLAKFTDEKVLDPCSTDCADMIQFCPDAHLRSGSRSNRLLSRTPAGTSGAS